MGRMCPYWVGCASRGGAHPVGQLGRAEEAAGQARLLCGPCRNGEGGWLGRSVVSWAARGKAKAEEDGLGWLQGELGFGPSLSRI
jgi:hypothetical protein